MNTKKLLLFLLTIALNALAQVPTQINYQGVARDINGNPIANQSIGLQFKISTSANPNFFNEAQTGITTNSLGLFTTKIGLVNPLPLSGWENLPAILNISININNAGFVPLNTQTLASVPYALYALNTSTGSALPTATVNGTTLKYNASSSAWEIDTNLVNDGARVSIGNRALIQNNKFRSIAGNGSDSAAIFGYHRAAGDGMAGVRGFASGSTSNTTNTVNTIGVLGGHFLGYNFSGQGIGSLSQGYSAQSNGIGIVGIGSSTGSNAGNNFAVGLYATTDATATAVNKYAGIFDRGGVLINDSLLLGITTNPGTPGDVLVRSSTGRARWQTPSTSTTTPSYFVNTANYLSVVPSFSNSRVVIGTPYPVGGYPYSGRFTVVNPPIWSSDTAVIILQQNTTRPALYSSAIGTGYAVTAINSNSTLSAYAGFFDGGLISRGKNSANSAYSFIARNAASNSLFSVRNDGFVGVGTINQTENLQVESSGNTSMSIIGNTNGTSNLYFGDGSLHFRGNILYDNQANSMNIWTNNTPNQVFIGSNGFMGLKTNNPGPYDLSIFNSSNSTSLRLNNSSSASSGLVLSINSVAANLISYENLPFSFGNNAITFMTAQPNGNLGIGSLSPSINSRLAIKDGHFQSQQTTAPAITGNNGATATFWGTPGTDVTGIIQLAMGTTTASGTQATITFNKTYSSIPSVIITPALNGYGAIAVSTCQVFVVPSTTGFTINFNNPFPNTSTTMYFNYMVIQGN